MVLKKIIFYKENNFFPKLSGKIFDFCIDKKPATFVVLIGKNGCGKTMLLNFLLQVFVLHKYIYPYSAKNNYWKKSDSKNIILHFNDNNYEVELSLSSKISTLDRSFLFSIDNIEGAMDYFTPMYQLTNSSQNSIDGDFLFKTNEIFFWMNDYIEISKIARWLKISPAWKKQIYKINFENARNNLFDLSNKPSYTDKVLDDDTYEHNEETKHLLKKISEYKFINKIKKLFTEKYNLKYDETKRLINEDDWYYPMDSLSSGLKRNFSLTLFFEDFFHNLKKFDKSNVFSFLFDEIEESLCPFEQQKIVEQIINWKNKMKGVKCQFFVTTHSPFILKNFLSEKRNNDTVIINVETGENILKSEKKKLLLNDNNISYDEISYLYYDIPTPSYYNSLYEKLKWKFDEYFEKKDLSKRKWDKCFFEFLCDIKLETLKDKIYKVDRIKSPDKLKKMKMEGQKEIDVKDLDDFCDNLTLLRDMLAHDDGNENWNVEIYGYSENNRIFEKNAKNKYFYESFKELSKNKSKLLLNEQIETIRTILINWEKIAK